MEGLLPALAFPFADRLAPGAIIMSDTVTTEVICLFGEHGGAARGACGTVPWMLPWI